MKLIHLTNEQASELRFLADNEGVDKDIVQALDHPVTWAKDGDLVLEFSRAHHAGYQHGHRDGWNECYG